MAEQLTSSDIIRERLGFGVSPLAAPETRRAYAAAGMSPLGTQERERFARGGALSPMASKSEKEAWKVAEVQAGLRDPIELPKSYGGLGERPEATTRRGFRMQQEWDKRYEMMQKEMEMARQIEERDREYALRLKDQNIKIEEAKTLADRDSRVMDEAGLIINSIRGAVAPDGTVISRPIRPEDDDAIESLENLARLQFGMENKSAQAIWSTLYNDAMKFREEKMAQSQQRERDAINLSVRTGKPFEEFGTYDERGMFQPKMESIIAGAEEIKASEEAKQEEKAIAREGRGEEARVKAREESDKRARRRQLDEDILTEEQTLIDFQNQKPSPSRDIEIKKAEAKLKNLHLRRGAIEGLTSDDLIYKDQDAYKKAVQGGKKLPSGTTIYIGGIPAKVK